MLCIDTKFQCGVGVFCCFTYLWCEQNVWMIEDTVDIPNIQHPFTCLIRGTAMFECGPYFTRNMLMSLASSDSCSVLPPYSLTMHP